VKDSSSVKRDKKGINFYFRIDLDIEVRIVKILNHAPKTPLGIFVKKS